MTLKYNQDRLRGVLKLSESEKNYHLTRILPSENLAYYVEQYWIVRWDLRGKKPHLQENIPHPCIHLVVEKNNSRIVGAVTRKFSYSLKDQGKIFGVKFRPGGFYPFISSPVSSFTDSTLTLDEVFGNHCESFIDNVLSGKDDKSPVETAEKFLQSFLPLNKDKNIGEVNRIIEMISADRGITKVEDLISSLDINMRSLQRLFNTYVGVGPKWVIKKYRLHEVLEKMESGRVDWQQLILDLGYYDQAHFIKDFKVFIGKSPLEYIKA